MRLREARLLGDFGSSRAALRFYHEANPKQTPIDIHGLLRRVEENDLAAIEAVTRQAVALGKGLGLITAALSPELILITGEITSSWQRFGPIVQEQLESAVLAGPSPRLAIAGDGEFARLLGAAAVFVAASCQLSSVHARSFRGTTTAS